jgi:peptidoglycan/xylan/chitin deacetylase (PgdA/CDA1 family)
MFLATGFAQGSTAAWWERLADAIRRGHTPRDRWVRRYRQLERSCRHRSSDVIARRLTSVDGGISDTEVPPGRRSRFVNWDDVCTASASGIDIENHTHSHTYLSHCTEAEAASEIAQANGLIGDHTGRCPRFFAFPGGGIRDIPSWSGRLVKRMRFAGAFAAGPVSRMLYSSDAYRRLSPSSVPILGRREVLWHTGRTTFSQWIR